ncbi:MAG: M67 family metallopeptidase [Gemmataceae bacterium]|nr:M67 family metallopeptidase [Gemmataceae bacterium]MCI0737572.1 M67 family metallopeptidase [Gemmataceae bacterium]
MSTSIQLLLPAQLYNEVLAQAQAELPNECCGLLAGHIEPPTDHRERSVAAKGREEFRVYRVSVRYPLVNEAASPREYTANPKGLFAATKDMREKGIELLAIYHSHPTAPPVPSKTDLERNFYPEAVHLIVSLMPTAPEMRVWQLEGDQFLEAELQVVDAD